MFISCQLNNNEIDWCCWWWGCPPSVVTFHRSFPYAAHAKHAGMQCVYLQNIKCIVMQYSSYIYIFIFGQFQYSAGEDMATDDESACEGDAIEITSADDLAGTASDGITPRAGPSSLPTPRLPSSQKKKKFKRSHTKESEDNQDKFLAKLMTRHEELSQERKAMEVEKPVPVQNSTRTNCGAVPLIPFHTACSRQATILVRVHYGDPEPGPSAHHEGKQSSATAASTNTAPTSF